MKSYLLFLFNMSAVEQVVYQPPAFEGGSMDEQFCTLHCVYQMIPVPASWNCQQDTKEVIFRDSTN